MIVNSGNLDYKELENNLVTCDYRGKEVKKQMFDSMVNEIQRLERKINELRNQCIYENAKRTRAEDRLADLLLRERRRQWTREFFGTIRGSVGKVGTFFARLVSRLSSKR